MSGCWTKRILRSTNHSCGVCLTMYTYRFRPYLFVLVLVHGPWWTNSYQLSWSPPTATTDWEGTGLLERFEMYDNHILCTYIYVLVTGWTLNLPKNCIIFKCFKFKLFFCGTLIYKSLLSIDALNYIFYSWYFFCGDVSFLLVFFVVNRICGL